MNTSTDQQLVTQFAEFFNSVPKRDFLNKNQELALRFDRDICIFATERKTIVVYVVKKVSALPTPAIEYYLFDENERFQAYKKAYEISGVVDVINFIKLLILDDKDFHDLTSHMPNAEYAKKYRQEMSQYRHSVTKASRPQEWQDDYIGDLIR